MIRLYIADDHQIMVDGLRQLVNQCNDIQFTGSATNGNDALQDIIRLKPDVVLLDLRMPGKDGLQVTHALKRQEKCKVIILSMYCEPRYLNDAKKFGADAYLLKNANRDELISTIRRVYAGEQLFFESLLQEEVAFTQREKDIVKLLIEGRQTNEIALLLNLSPHTVSTHRKNILRKAGCNNMAGLSHYVITHNLLAE